MKLIRTTIAGLYFIIECYAALFRMMGTFIYQVFGKPTLPKNDQSWFWTEEWQKGEREVDKLYSKGEFETYDNIEDFLDTLITEKKNNNTIIMPCPICKQEMSLDSCAMGFWLVCRICDIAQSSYYPTKEDAIEAWNKLFQLESEDE